MKYKVTLEFEYDIEEESHNHISSKSDAIDQAIKEINQSHVASMNFNVEEMEEQLLIKTPSL